MTGGFSGDPRTPILVGAGQYVQRVDNIDEALDPVGMMCAAIRAAASDATLAAVPDPDSLAVVSLLSWRYGDPAFLIAEQLGVKAGETALTTMGGNSPQSLVNAMALEIQQGDREHVILRG